MTGYYRAALAAAKAGDYTAALRLARISAALGEEAPSAPRLLELLQKNEAAFETADAQNRMRELAKSRRYRKALKVPLTGAPKSHTIKGMLYALLGRNRAARSEFAAALALNPGDETALRALRACRKTKWWN